MHHLPQGVTIDRYKPLIEVHTELNGMSISVYGVTAGDVMKALTEFEKMVREEEKRKNVEAVSAYMSKREILNG